MYRKIFFLFLLLSLALPASDHQVAAAPVGTVISVTTTDDELNADGDCSLREAVVAANTDLPVDACPAGAGSDTINLPAGVYTLAIAGVNEDAAQSGDLDILASVSITGAGQEQTILDAAQLDRIFHLPFEGVTVSITGVTIQNGIVYLDGGDSGAGIHTHGRLTINNSTLAGNEAYWEGGGIFQAGGTLNIGNTTFDGNHAHISGGGICQGGGDLKITSSTFFNNIADVDGGGVDAFAGSLRIINSTFSHNWGDEGGGALSINGAQVTLESVTMTENTGEAGGGIFFYQGSVRLHNTILAGNLTIYEDEQWSGPDCYSYGDSFPDIVIRSNGYNLVGKTERCYWESGPGDILGTIAEPVVPKLGLLAQSGGLTQTYSLLPGSPAVDAGDPGSCPAKDQRGKPRPKGLGCDIGSFEQNQLVVGIDIYPGVSPNQIQLTSSGTLPVAIISTTNFSAPGRVVRNSLSFGHTGWEPSLRKLADGSADCSSKDVNGDRLPDLVCRFKVSQTGVQCGDTHAILRGKIKTDDWIVGQDSVVITGCP